MNNITEIIETVKDVICFEIKGRITNRDVASALLISEQKLASCKFRNSIPFKEIMDFCVDRKININTVFYNQKITGVA